MGAFLLIGTPGAGGHAPNTPSITVADNGDGSGGTATIAGSSAGSTNTVDVVSVASTGALTWQTFTRTGDGTLDLTLADGRYLALAASALGGLNAAPSEPFEFTTSGGGSLSTPAGNFPIALTGVAWLIASSTNFQNLVGQSSATLAMPFVKLEADDTEESGSTRPRAIVYPAPEGYTEEAVALDNFRPSFHFWVSFEAAPPGSVELTTPRETRLWDEMIWFTNTVQAILDDCKANQGAGTGFVAGLGQVRLKTIRLIAGPGACEEVRAEGELGEVAEYFYGATFEFEIHG